MARAKKEKMIEWIDKNKEKQLCLFYGKAKFNTKFRKKVSSAL
jgi:hypothetical protein